jgi:hypothetical protein
MANLNCNCPAGNDRGGTSFRPRRNFFSAWLRIRYRGQLLRSLAQLREKTGDAGEGCTAKPSRNWP